MIKYQVLFIDVSRLMHRHDEIEEYLELVNLRLDKYYFRNQSIRISKRTLVVISSVNQTLNPWFFEDDLTSDCIEKLGVEDPNYYYDMGSYIEFIDYYFVSVSRKEAFKYCLKYHKEFEHIESIVVKKTRY